MHKPIKNSLFLRGTRQFNRGTKQSFVYIQYILSCIELHLHLLDSDKSKDNLSSLQFISVTEAIENCMKKQAENLVNSLDVISGRLSQLELYCYKLERSIGELRSDVMDYHGEANSNFSGLEKHLKEVCLVLRRHMDTQLLSIEC